MNRSALAFAFVRKRLGETDAYSLLESILVIVIATIAMPGIVSLFVNVSVNALDAELYTTADLLASEQMETILADKAGSGVGFGYAAITSGKYASVQPGAPFTAFSRTVQVTVVNAGQQYEYKKIVVTVSHPMISPVVLTGAVFDHSGL